MKIYNIQQGTEAWLKLRLGIPTASKFEKIVTPTGKLSTQARSYAYFLIAEQLLGYSLEDIGNLPWIARGKELESQAVEMLEFERDMETLPVGFLLTDDGRMGCTPDRLVKGAPGAVEIKCPAPQTHIAYMLEGFGADYIPQVQGQMLVGEFEWVDRYSYHPELPPVLVRTYRDDMFIDKLRDALAQFCDAKDAMLEKVKARGYFEERAKPGDHVGAEFDLPPLPGDAA